MVTNEREVWRNDPAYVMDAERGAVAPVPGLAGIFWVKGTTQCYEVSIGRPDRLERGTCECKGFEYRQHCAHLDAVAEFCGRMRRVPRLSAWVQEHWFGRVVFEPGNEVADAAVEFLTDPCPDEEEGEELLVLPVVDALMPSVDCLSHLGEAARKAVWA